MRASAAAGLPRNSESERVGGPLAAEDAGKRISATIGARRYGAHCDRRLACSFPAGRPASGLGIAVWRDVFGMTIQRMALTKILETDMLPMALIAIILLFTAFATERSLA